MDGRARRLAAMADDETEPRQSIEGRNGAILFPWPKGVSGNPAGRPPGTGNMLQRLFQEKIEDEGTALLLWTEYTRLCLYAKSEDLRAKMLIDLMDRMGLPRTTSDHSPAAVAQVVNIIRNSPDLGV